MTPSQQCKAAGLKSLAELVRISGESEQNIINWHKKRPLRFRLLLAGAVIERRSYELNDRLDDLLKLQKGWDSYNAPAINERAVAKAKEIAALFPGDSWQAVPCSSSAVQLGKYGDGFDIEIYIEAV
jgi:hypothetical protein